MPRGEKPFTGGGAWTIAKGEYAPDEDPLDAARRELTEETGCVPEGPFIPLGSITQTAGKIVTAWAAELDWDPARLVSNTFELEWPRGSGERHSYPEVDRAAWFGMAEAGRRILPAQAPLLDTLTRLLKDADAQARL